MAWNFCWEYHEMQVYVDSKGVESRGFLDPNSTSDMLEGVGFTCPYSHPREPEYRLGSVEGHAVPFACTWQPDRSQSTQTLNPEP